MQALQAAAGSPEDALHVQVGYETLWIAYKTSPTRRNFVRYVVEIVADGIRQELKTKD